MLLLCVVIELNMSLCECFVSVMSEAEFIVMSCALQECISQSALITKFAHHVTNAGVIICDLRKLWEELHRTSQQRR